MRILYHYRIKSRDGQYIHIRSMIDALKRDGQWVEEVGLTAKESYSLGEESPFWKTIVDLVPSPVMEILEYIYSLPAALWLWSRILRNRPDLIYERYALGNFAGVLAALDEKYGSVMVVGHNPGLEELVEGLTGSHEILPTAALVLVELPIERWSELALNGTGRLKSLWCPKELD